MRSSRRRIADTEVLVASANADDAPHGWATQIAASVTESLLSCEAVLAETAFHLGAVAFAMLSEGLVALAFDCRGPFIQLTCRADRYADREPDLVALCLVRMSKLFAKPSVITIDRADFGAHSRNKRKAIPILCPPER